MPDENTLVILSPSFEHRSDECNPEASAPVAAKVRQTGALVFFVFRQVRVCELSYRHEHEGVAEALISPGERKVKVVGLAGKTAVIEHGNRRDSETHRQQTF